ncbi:MAG: hypothetical protein N2C14_27535 [Planctomycetales bacterium]
MANDQDQIQGTGEQEEKEDNRLSIAVTVIALILLGVFWHFSPKGFSEMNEEALSQLSSQETGLALGFLMMQVVVISIVIWQVCDPFADAAQWVGTTLRIPGSVRGATLDAVASSMPELFTGVFFVLLALWSAGGADVDLAKVSGEGYGATIATCAGSAIYNMILIPAVCALVISYTRKERPTIDIEAEVIARDGMWFVACEAVLLYFLWGNKLDAWMGVVFLVMYAVYVCHLVRDAKIYRKAHHAVREHLKTVSGAVSNQDVIASLRADGVNATPALIDQIRDEPEGAGEEEDCDSAGVLFGFFDVPLNAITATLVLVSATLLAAGACYFLVEATMGTAELLGVPIFFVAVILAAAASSVPDTFLSIGSAKRGDDSGAVSNAFGSNIFDICICLAVPMLICCLYTGQSIDLTHVQGLWMLRIVLLTLTLITLAIMWHNRQLTRNKAFVLCGLYAIFVAFAIGGSIMAQQKEKEPEPAPKSSTETSQLIETRDACVVLTDARESNWNRPGASVGNLPG